MDIFYTFSKLVLIKTSKYSTSTDVNNSGNTQQLVTEFCAIFVVLHQKLRKALADLMTQPLLQTI